MSSAVLASSYVDWASMGKILLISVVVGAGGVTVYAIGLRALSVSGYLHQEGDEPGQPRRVALLVVAVICLVVVVAAAVYGIHVMFAKG
jgi:hypothetical protein